MTREEWNRLTPGKTIVTRARVFRVRHILTRGDESNMIALTCDDGTTMQTNQYAVYETPRIEWSIKRSQAIPKRRGVLRYALRATGSILWLCGARTMGDLIWRRGL